MKLKKCPNGHFYNASEYERCPDCHPRSMAESIASPPSIAVPEMSDEILLQPSVSSEMKTVAMWEAPAGSEPITGWLVCVRGSYFGQSFDLKAGNNSVGRSMDMDVPLAQEDTVSRNRHCIITFEPEKQAFFIQPGEGGGLTYLNSNLVTTFTKINARDKINLGNCEFIFYPLCGDKFSWKNVI